MPTHPLKLVTVIAEPVLETKLTHELRALGATGFTVVEGRGEGSRGRHAGEIPGVNIRIEAIVSPEVAERIMERFAAQYFNDYAMVVYQTDVAVIRGDKYLGGR
jgi:nitrogen regulatory protein P-II 2